MQPEERIITGQEQDADVWQYSLRPRRLAEYIGQNQVKQNMEVFIKAARSCAFIWSAWSGENHISKYYCQ